MWRINFSEINIWCPMKSKFLSYLGLSMRAGKLAMGDEGVLKSIRSGEAKLVIVAEDASENTKKKYKDKCHSYRVPLMECCNRTELGRSIGKEERVIIAVTDSGLAKLIRKCEEKRMEVE